MLVNFEISDDKIKNAVNNALVGAINSALKKNNIIEMVRHEGTEKIRRYYDKSYKDGSFIAKLSKSVAKEIVSEVEIDKIFNAIDINEIKIMVADRIAEKIFEKMSK